MLIRISFYLKVHLSVFKYFNTDETDFDVMFEHVKT